MVSSLHNLRFGGKEVGQNLEARLLVSVVGRKPRYYKCGKNGHIRAECDPSQVLEGSDEEDEEEAATIIVPSTSTAIQDGNSMNNEEKGVCGLLSK